MFIAAQKINHVKMYSLMALMELKFHFCFNMNIVFCITNSNHESHACICLQKSIFKNYGYILCNVNVTDISYVMCFIYIFLYKKTDQIKKTTNN